MDNFIIILAASLNLLTTAGLVVVVALISSTTKKLQEKTTQPVAPVRAKEVDVSKSLEESTHQLEFIDYTILSLISMKMSNKRILGTPIDMKNIDRDVENLSLDVMNAIDKRFFGTTTSFYNKEFLMKYIIEKSKTSLIEAYKQSRTN